MPSLQRALRSASTFTPRTLLELGCGGGNIHDAIVYMLSAADLAKAIETAFVHCRPGGAALFAPDHTRETFKASTSHGGHDRANRSLRYLEWTWDPDGADTTYISDMVYVLRQRTDAVRCVHDRHICGLFGHDDWRDSKQFQATRGPLPHWQHPRQKRHAMALLKEGTDG